MRPKQRAADASRSAACLGGGQRRRVTSTQPEKSRPPRRNERTSSAGASRRNAIACALSMTTSSIARRALCRPGSSAPTTAVGASNDEPDDRRAIERPHARRPDEAQRGRSAPRSPRLDSPPLGPQRHPATAQARPPRPLRSIRGREGNPRCVALSRRGSASAARRTRTPLPPATPQAPDDRARPAVGRARAVP
jgi:hypothetical protein